MKRTQRHTINGRSTRKYWSSHALSISKTLRIPIYTYNTTWSTLQNWSCHYGNITPLAESPSQRQLALVEKCLRPINGRKTVSVYGTNRFKSRVGGCFKGSDTWRNSKSDQGQRNMIIGGCQCGCWSSADDLDHWVPGKPGYWIDPHRRPRYHEVLGMKLPKRSFTGCLECLRKPCSHGLSPLVPAVSNLPWGSWQRWYFSRFHN